MAAHALHIGGISSLKLLLLFCRLENQGIELNNSVYQKLDFISRIILMVFTGWEGSRVKGKWVRPLFPRFLFLPLAFGRSRETNGEAMPTLPTAFLMSIQGSRCGACAEGSASLVLMVLRCCQSRKSSDKEILPRAIG